MSKQPWWQTDEYSDDTALPSAFTDLAGAQGVALVRAWPDGRTDTGWGGDTFVAQYNNGAFNARRVLYGFDRDRWAFAMVMRSVRMVCIDIDGKNGGLEHAKKLGLLPLTLAETSKSGDGYHLFFEVDESWSDQWGFASLSDRIGIEQGVDIRATGCVYHHKQQRWNGREVAPLPDHLLETLVNRDQKIAATTARIQTVLANHDDLEILMMHDEMLADLAKPIPQGKRNQTLFAIGTQMHNAQVPDWEDKLIDRGIQVGLDSTEIDKLVANIKRYAA